MPRGGLYLYLDIFILAYFHQRRLLFCLLLYNLNITEPLVSPFLLFSFHHFNRLFILYLLHCNMCIYHGFYKVMLLKNLDTQRGLVNGTRGTVVGFEDTRENDINSRFPMVPKVLFEAKVGSDVTEIEQVIVEDIWDIRQGEQVLASRDQIPLVLAWAISIHKAQGMTISKLEVSFRGMFEYGQAYVALSRATSLEGLFLSSFDERAIKVHIKVRVRVRVRVRVI